MKKIIIIICVSGLVAFIDAKLRIRQKNPTWRTDEVQCCIDRRTALTAYSAGSAEDAVLALQEEINAKYDSGMYQADKMNGWQKDRNVMLEIQSQLGFTPESTEEDDSFDSSYDDAF